MRAFSRRNRVHCGEECADGPAHPLLKNSRAALISLFSHGNISRKCFLKTRVMLSMSQGRLTFFVRTGKYQKVSIVSEAGGPATRVGLYIACDR